MYFNLAPCIQHDKNILGIFNQADCYNRQPCIYKILLFLFFFPEIFNHRPPDFTV